MKAIDKSVTPGIPDTPYIQYALEALTRRRDDSLGYPGHDSTESGNSYPGVHQLVPNATPALFQPHVTRPPPETTHVPESSPVRLRAERPQPYATPVEQHQHYAPVSPLSPQQQWHEASSPSPETATAPNQPPYEVQDRFTPTLIPERHLAAGADGSRMHNNRTPQSYASVMISPREVEHWEAEPIVPDGPADLEKARGIQSLTFKPWILRDPSLLLLMTLCILMVAAIIFCAVYSTGRNGFMSYGDSMYGGDYFLFRVLPQLLGAVILFYAQGVISASFRILPFSLMASEDVRERQNAIFLPMYPRSFLWPQFVGPWNVWIPKLNVWLLNFTIPLLCSLFTVRLVDGVWTWATVQGAAWTLVALYVSLLLGMVIVFVYWHGRTTGMLNGWDLRTLADIIYISAQSNSLRQYQGIEMLADRKQMETVLRDNVEKLGLWYSNDVPDFPRWYSIGVPNNEEKVAFQTTGGPMWERLRDGSAVRPPQGPADEERYQYLPWCLRTGQVTFFAVASTILFIALVVVSFNHATDVRDGFLPGVSAAPREGVFSAANFLYSFLPSIIGMILFLGFQSLDQTVRILAPWGELLRADGSRADTSLLLDYAACTMPWEAAVKALARRHWRVALVSTLSPLFVLLPALGGSLFMALTPPTMAVRMYPNMAALGIVLALLALLSIALALLVPGRDGLRLPHAVTRLAEVLSFVCAEDLRTDDAFNYPRTPRELRARLGAGADPHLQSRWAFTAGAGAGGGAGVRRISTYTVRPDSVPKYDRLARGEDAGEQQVPQQGAYVPGGGDEYYAQRHIRR